MRQIPLVVALIITGFAVPAPAHAACSNQLVNSIELRINRVVRDVDVRQLSCNGVTQVFFLLERRHQFNRFQLRQRTLAVFRREGLIA